MHSNTFIQIKYAKNSPKRQKKGKVKIKPTYWELAVEKKKRYVNNKNLKIFEKINHFNAGSDAYIYIYILKGEVGYLYTCFIF